MKHLRTCLLVVAGCGSIVEEPAATDAGSEPVDAGVGVETDAAIAEQCNGTDDDGDGIADEGCPAAGPLAYAPGTSSAMFGGEVTFGQPGTPIERRCPLGSVVVGLHGRAYESIDAVGVRCGTPAVTVSKAPPFSYAIEIADGATLAVVGGAGGTAFEARCPANMAVAGAMVMTATTDPGASIFGVVLECAALAIDRTPTPVVVRSGEPVALARVGSGNAGITPMPSTFGCASGELLGGITGAYGPWPLYNAYTTVNAMQLHCVKASVPVIGS